MVPVYFDQMLSPWVISNDSDVRDRLYSTIVQNKHGHITQKEYSQISEFCNRTLIIIEAARTRRAIRPSNAQIRSDIAALNSTINSTVRELDNIIQGRVYLSDVFGEFDKIESDSWRAESDKILFIQREAMTAKRSLVLLSAALEVQAGQFHLRKGRPPVDDTRFVKALAFLFRRYIGRPTTYDSGPFFGCVSIALEAVGLPHADPSRAILIAVAENPAE